MKLILHTTSGLSGRLLAIIAAYRLAKLSGRSLEVIWNVSDVPCKFTDLFDEPEFPVYEGKIKKDSSPIDVFSSEPIINTWSMSIFGNKGIYPPDDDLFQYCSILKPKQKILDEVNKFTENKKNMLGVHLRRHQIHLGDNCNTPYITYINKKISDDPEIKLFLSTDCKDTLEIFNVIYWDRIHSYTNNTFSRHSLKDMEIALINIFILSWCIFILRSGNSGFSYLPCLLGKTPNLIL